MTASGGKEGPLPSHSVPAPVMQMMSKVKVRPKTSEVEALGFEKPHQEVSQKQSRGQDRGAERGAHSAVPPPEASLREFDVRLDMTGKSGLGLDVDWADGKTLYIKSVKPEGAVVVYNESCPKGNMVQSGDRVVAINDRSGDPKAMLAEVKSKRQLHLVVRTSREAPAPRPGKPPPADAAPEAAEAAAPAAAGQHEFTVTLDMAGKSGLGLDVDWRDGKTLYIKSVKADGAVADWNRRCPQEDLVQGGDRVIAINGKTGDPKAMLAECKSKTQLQLKVRGQREQPAGGGATAQAFSDAPQERRAPAAAAAPARARAEAEAAAAAAQPARASRAPKAHEFIVSLDMSRHNSLGLDVDWADGKTLYINSVQPGAIQEWNKEHPLHQQVSAGDRIIAVNGYADDPEAMASLCKELCTMQCSFQMVVRGPPPPPSAAAAAPPDDGGADRDKEKEKDKDRRERKGKKGRDESSEDEDKKARRGKRERDGSEGGDSSDKERKERRDREDKKARKKREQKRSSS